MARVIASLLLMVLLSSCVKNNIEPEYPIEIAGKFQVEYNEVKVLADAVYNDGILTVNVESPVMQFVISKTNIKVISNGLQLTYNNNELDDFCPFMYLYESLLQLNNDKPQFEFNGDFYRSELDCSGNKCEVYLNKDRLLSKIKYKNLIFDFGL